MMKATLRFVCLDVNGLFSFGASATGGTRQAWLAARASSDPTNSKGATGDDRDTFVLINILNPKLSIFFLAFLALGAKLALADR